MTQPHQYERVRDGFTCPRCWGSKDQGTLLCWPCHHKEKNRHDGCYSKTTERAIAAYNDLMGG